MPVRDKVVVTTRLQLIAHRRNQIVHEFDCDPVALGARHPIDLVLVTGTVDFISNTVEAIEAVAV
jgi:hypothetical protein